MPDTPIPIPSLPAASTLTGSELVPGDQSGTTVKITTSAIAALAAGGVTGVGLSGTPRTGTIVLAPGTNLAIVESPSGTFTFNASSGAGAGRSILQGDSWFLQNNVGSQTHTWLHPRTTASPGPSELIGLVTTAVASDPGVTAAGYTLAHQFANATYNCYVFKRTATNTSSDNFVPTFTSGTAHMSSNCYEVLSSTGTITLTGFATETVGTSGLLFPVPAIEADPGDLLIWVGVQASSINPFGPPMGWSTDSLVTNAPSDVNTFCASKQALVSATYSGTVSWPWSSGNTGLGVAFKCTG